MSLEAKIEKLTSAVELLTKAILERNTAELQSEGYTIDEPQTEKQPEEKQVEKPESKKAEKAEKSKTEDITAEDVQAVCLAIVREDSRKKEAIVDLLAEYGAKTVGQVKPDKLSELKAKLETL